MKYRVLSPLKYGRDHYTVDSPIEIEDQRTADGMIADHLIEAWPESDAERAAREKAERRAKEESQGREAQDEASGQDAAKASAPATGEGDSPAGATDQNSSQQDGGEDASRTAAQDAKDAPMGASKGARGRKHTGKK